jgi:hemoglobin
MNSLWKRYAFLAACCFALHLAGPARSADDDMPDVGGKSETKLYQSLREIINHGADLYNAGDRNGAYRLFEGALLALKTQLATRPDIVKLIDTGIADANRERTAGHRAFALRRTLVDVRTKLKGEAVAVEGPEKIEKQPKTEPEKIETQPKTEPKKVAGKTLWDRLGGEKAVTKVVDEFVEKAGEDAAVNVTRNGKIKLDDEAVAKLKKGLVTFISSATGGPLKYTGKSMKEVHKGMGITDKEFDAAGALLKGVLEENRVNPADIDELMKIVGTTRKDIVEAKGAPEPEEKKKVEEKKKPTETGDVAGEVKFDGKPVDKADVIFVPVTKLDDMSLKATTGDDGGFDLNQVPVGDYKVVIKGGGVPADFGDAKKTTLKYTVKAGNNPASFEIPK